jgi:hypothetical protein
VQNEYLVAKELEPKGQNVFLVEAPKRIEIELIELPKKEAKYTQKQIELIKEYTKKGILIRG